MPPCNSLCDANGELTTCGNKDEQICKVHGWYIHYTYAPGSINSHYFHIIGDKLINPIVGVYIPIIRKYSDMEWSQVSLSFYISGQITIIPKPKLRVFWGDSLTFHHHLGWPTGGKGRYTLPRYIYIYYTYERQAKLNTTGALYGT